MRPSAQFLLAALMACLPVLCARGADKDKEPVEAVGTQPPGDEIDIVMKGIVYKGRIVLPCTDLEFSFQIRGFDKPTAFRWANLDEYERKRVQKLYGMEIADGHQVFGEKVPGVRLKLKTGKSIEGLRVT